MTKENTTQDGAAAVKDVSAGLPVNPLNLSKLSGVELIHLVNGMMIRNQNLQDLLQNFMKGAEDLNQAKVATENGARFLAKKMNEAMDLIGQVLTADKDGLAPWQKLEDFFVANGGKLEKNEAAPPAPPSIPDKKTILEGIENAAKKKASA